MRLAMASSPGIPLTTLAGFRAPGGFLIFTFAPRLARLGGFTPIPVPKDAPALRWGHPAATRLCKSPLGHGAGPALEERGGDGAK